MSEGRPNHSPGGLEDVGSGGYHWQSEDRVDLWEAKRQALDSDRRQGFQEMLAVLPALRMAPLRVLDLGAGDGKVAETILDAYPHSRAVLVDFSQPMMEKGRLQLSRFDGRFSYVHWDMNHGDWPEDLAGLFDMVASSAAIHHLDNSRKRWLADQVFRHLATGGVFANYDLYRDADAEFGEHEVHARTCATLAEATSFLDDAGFSDVRVTARSPRPAHKGELALVLGTRPRS
jgi:SAM-dependent methyltransferase